MRLEGDYRLVMYSHALKSLQNAPSGRLDAQNIFKTIFKDYCYQVYADTQ